MMPADIANVLKEAIGLDASSIGNSAIESAVKSRMASLGLESTGDYCDLLHESKKELQELVEVVIVPETWFFREPEAFSLLSRVVISESLSRHPGDVLHVLSGACCSGEEPYSIAMALLDAGLAKHQFHIFAIDISERALKYAKRRLYGSKSFRGKDLSYRDRYFEHTAGGYLLADWIGETVTFVHGNLLTPQSCLECMSYQFIFCRNLLIYLDRDTQEQVLRNLGSLLKPEGLLFVGAAEAFQAACVGFKSVDCSMAFAFRTDGTAESVATKTSALAAPKFPKLKSPLKPPTLKGPKNCPPPVIPNLPEYGLIDLKSVKTLADTGHLAEASDRCEAFLGKHGNSVEGLYLLGVLKDALGEPSRAAECYRKVLYLEPNHTEALMQLALLTEKLGDRAVAGRLRVRARRAFSLSI